MTTATFEDAATKTVIVRDTPFVYRDIGAGSGVPVLLLHHVTAVLEDWDPAFIDGPARMHRVIIFDNRGVGGSGGNAPNSIDEMAADAAAFIGALGLTKVDIVGFSMGGFVAQVIAHNRPDLVRRMVLAALVRRGASMARARRRDLTRKGNSR